MILPYKKQLPKIHPDAYIADSASIIGRVTLAKGASIWFGSVLRGDINQIKIGENSNIQDNCVLHVEKNRACIVKKGVTVGHQATIHACTVHDSSLIGIGARILDGASIGKYSIIGAGAVVLENCKIPPYSLAVGVPAKVIRKLTSKEIMHLEKSAKNYVALAKRYKKNHQLITLNSQITPISDLSRIF